MALPLLQLAPEYRDYVWGGSRLKPGVAPIAEAWIVYEQDQVVGGPFAGQTLADLSARFGEELLGHYSAARTGSRFPLLIKLLDCAQWLSLQVHPDDEQARRLEGPAFFGKTEAWHVLESGPGARLIAGLKPGTSAETLAAAIRNGTIIDWVQYYAVRAGDSIFMRPGTIHALGPGLLIYEVQQTSDLTYRVWDWNRPQTGRRVLHIDKSLAVTNPSSTGDVRPMTPVSEDDSQTLVACPYFTLALLRAQARPCRLDTRGSTFHALTIIDGQAEVEAGGAKVPLHRFETVVVPAAVGPYDLSPLGSCRVLCASVEPA
jgi:mannose-6-phosphate isomerase